MLHRMCVFSAEVLLDILEDQTNQTVHIKDLVQPIPESTEEQEKFLQVCVVLFFFAFHLLACLIKWIVLFLL